MVGNLFGAGPAAGVRGVPVGQPLAGVCEVGADDAYVFVGEVAQAPGGVGIGRVAEAVEELRQGAEGVIQPGEDAVVRRREFGEDGGCFVGVGGFTETLGEAGDRGTEGGIADGPGIGVEERVAVDVISGRPQACDGVGGEAGLVVLGECGGGPVVALVEADDGDEARALEDAVCLGVAAAGEEFVGVRVAADVQEAVGAGQGDVSPKEIGRRCARR
ncbi:hypothetical protein [Streptomyces sp. NPDC008092]|uniref:hypothetical protein n=1 Tax=Streptomyces sp. NPDC008092 TaxID=3364808 RepID=UPI0036F16419